MESESFTITSVRELRPAIFNTIYLGVQVILSFVSYLIHRLFSTSHFAMEVTLARAKFSNNPLLLFVIYIDDHITKYLPYSLLQYTIFDQ